MLQFLITILLLLASVTCTATPSNPLVPLDLFRWYGQSSLVVGPFVYIDGGVAIDKTNTTYALTFTLVIDLRESWTTSDVNATRIEKPEEFPLAYGQLMWADTKEDTIYVFGGECFWSNNAADSPTRLLGDGTIIDQNVQGSWTWKSHDQVPWALRLNGNGTGGWGEVEDAGASQNVQVTLGSSAVLTDTKFFSIAGEVVSPRMASSAQTSALTTILSVDRDDPSVWKSTNDPGYTVGIGTGEEHLVNGEAVFTPLFGRNGSVIMFGGLVPDSRIVDHVQRPDGLMWDMSSIVIYDVANDDWMAQKATGDVPAGSYGLCAVTATDTENSQLDIFVVQGTASDYKATSASHLFSCVYVLTLPSFVWTRVNGSDSANSEGRNMQTCTNIGGGHMLVVGGQSDAMGNDESPFPHKAKSWSGGSPDPWANGIGIFDMNNLSWTEQYNASRSSYKRQDLLVNISNTTPYPQDWTSPKVEEFFKQPTYPQPSGNKSQRGAIIGGTIGGVAGVVIIVIGTWFFCHERRQSRRDRSSTESTIQLHPFQGQIRHQGSVHLDGNPRVELASPDPELPHREQFQELPATEKQFEMSVTDHTVHELDSRVLTWEQFLERLKNPEW